MQKIAASNNWQLSLRQDILILTPQLTHQAPDAVKFILPKALAQLNNYIDYLQYTLLNDQAAYNMWQDSENTFLDELNLR